MGVCVNRKVGVKVVCVCVCVCVCICGCERGGEIPTLHRQTTGDGAHSRPNSQAAQETQQRPVPPAFLHGESCVDKRPAAKQRCGLEDSSHRDTRTTTAQKSRDGHGTTAPSCPNRSNHDQQPSLALLLDRREKILLGNVHSLQTASPVTTKP